MTNNIEILEGEIFHCITVGEEIPEFYKSKKTLEDITERLKDKNFLMLIAKVGDNVVGFKLGYELNNGTFYSWLGGVLPKYRKLGIAKKLSEFQEMWVKENGFKKIQFKTMNRFKPMLIFGLSNGFEIISFSNETDKDELKILLEKEL